MVNFSREPDAERSMSRRTSPIHQCFRAGVKNPVNPSVFGSCDFVDRLLCREECTIHEVTRTITNETKKENSIFDTDSEAWVNERD